MDTLSQESVGLTLDRDNESWEQVIVAETKQVMWKVTTPAVEVELVSEETLNAAKANYQYQIRQLQERIEILTQQVAAVDAALEKIAELSQDQQSKQD